MDGACGDLRCGRRATPAARRATPAVGKPRAKPPSTYAVRLSPHAPRVDGGLEAPGVPGQAAEGTSRRNVAKGTSRKQRRDGDVAEATSRRRSPCPLAR